MVKSGSWIVGLLALGAPAGYAQQRAASGACAGLSQNERSSCPLTSLGEVQSVEDVPGGVRISYVPVTIGAARLRAVMACQPVASTCAFVSADTRVSVDDAGGHTVVDVTAGPGADEGVLRTRVRVAFDEYLRVGNRWPR